jgi:hypothetical protein
LIGPTEEYGCPEILEVRIPAAITTLTTVITIITMSAEVIIMAVLMVAVITADSMAAATAEAIISCLK